MPPATLAGYPPGQRPRPPQQGSHEARRVERGEAGAPGGAPRSPAPAPGWDQGMVVRPRAVAPSAPTRFGSAADAWRGQQAVVPRRDTAHQPTLLAFGAGSEDPLPPGSAAQGTPEHGLDWSLHAPHPGNDEFAASRDDDTPLVAVHHTVLRSEEDTPLVVTRSEDDAPDYTYQPAGSPYGSRAEAAEEPELPRLAPELIAEPSVLIDPSLTLEADEGIMARVPRLDPGPQPAPRVVRRGRTHWAQQSTVMLPSGSPVPSALSRGVRWVISRSATAVLILSGFATLGAVGVDRFLEYRGKDLRDQAEQDPAAVAEIEMGDGVEAIEGIGGDEFGAPSDTLIVSDPPGAEVIHSGSVVGRTPVLVPREVEGSVYLLRKPGYQPQMVQVRPTTPSALNITLKELGASTQ